MNDSGDLSMVRTVPRITRPRVSATFGPTSFLLCPLFIFSSARCWRRPEEQRESERGHLRARLLRGPREEPNLDQVSILFCAPARRPAGPASELGLLFLGQFVRYFGAFIAGISVKNLCQRGRALSDREVHGKVLCAIKCCCPLRNRSVTVNLLRRVHGEHVCVGLGEQDAPEIREGSFFSPRLNAAKVRKNSFFFFFTPWATRSDNAASLI